MNADAISEFITFMTANGVEPAEPIAAALASGALIRFDCKGDRKGRKNGWAILHLDSRPVGAFGSHKLNTGTLKWIAGTEGPALSQAEREALQREWREAQRRREADRRDAAQAAAITARGIWSGGSNPASPDHPYAVRKLLQVAPLRQSGNQLLIPMFDDEGAICNLQRIAPDGTKRFLKGGRVDGAFSLVGLIDNRTTEVVIAEGYASADAINQATGLPTIAALSAHNLLSVARLWHSRRPDLTYTVFGDDDRGTEAKTGRNPGREAAIAAATAIGAMVTFPLGVGRVA